MSLELEHVDEAERALAVRAFEPSAPVEATDAPTGSQPLSIGGVLALQRSAGNRAVARMLRGSRDHAHDPAADRSTADRPAQRAMPPVANLLARCPDGRCVGACTCLEEDEAERDKREGRAAPLAKEQGGGLEEGGDQAVGDAPVQVVVRLVPEDEAGATGGSGAEGTAGAADTGALSKTRTGQVQVTATEVPAGPDSARAGPALLNKATTSVAGGAAPSKTLGAGTYGLTFPESIAVTMGARKVGASWQPVVSALVGNFSEQVRLLPGQSEVTGPGGNSNGANFCNQVKGLKTLGNTTGNPWYMIAAVRAHEDVHATRFGPALVAAEPMITAALEAVTIPDVAGMTQAAAVAALTTSPAFQAAVRAAVQTWLAEILTRVAGDHAAGGPTDVAEHGVVDPMVTRICTFAVTPPPWPACPDCP